MRYILLILIFSISLQLGAQQTPAEKQTQTITIFGATAHIGNGEVIENSVIVFKNGKITFIGKSEDAPSMPDVGKIIKANGKHVYPGFIALESSLGLVEIGAVRATRDSRELGYLNPSLRSIIAFNTDSKVIPTVRSNGILLAHIVPAGGTMPGQSSVVQLDAWNWEDAAIATDIGIHLSWPSTYRRLGWWAEPGGIKPNENYKSEVDKIKMFFGEAKAYSNGSSPKQKNLKFEAMRGLFDGSKKLYIRAGQAKSMMAACLFAKEMNLDPVIVGADDSWLIADFLKEQNVEVILSAAHSLPDRKEDDIDITYKLPKILHEAGVTFAISNSGYYEQRNLPFQAGHAVGFGLPYEEAIKSITLSPAKILGIDNNYGSLEKGKSATLFISTGDVLDMRSSQVEDAFIDGRKIDLDNKQSALYRKFSDKYEKQNAEKKE